MISYSRVSLAAALQLLQIALNIHRLLLRPEQTGSIDSFLLGGTILAGDYCFSRAAVLAAHTNHPQVVMVFAELLQEVSQANLRRVSPKMVIARHQLLSKSERPCFGAARLRARCWLDLPERNGRLWVGMPLVWVDVGIRTGSGLLGQRQRRLSATCRRDRGNAGGSLSLVSEVRIRSGRELE